MSVAQERLRRPSGAVTLIFAVIVGALSCGDDSSSEPVGAGTQLFVVGSSTFDTDFNQTGFFQVVDSLDDPIRLDNAVEVPGGAGVFGLPSTGRFYVGEGESPTIRRYLVGQDGSFQRDGPSISLANFGVVSASESAGRVPFVSANKAYFIERTGTVVVWNPETMEITGSIDLGLPSEESFRTNLETAPKLVNGKLYIAFGFWDFANVRVLPRAGVVVIDTATDQVVNTAEDPRCGGIFHSALADDGFIYYACGTYIAAANRIFGQSNAPESCLLRIEVGENEWDADFYVPIQSITGGRIGGELVGAGDALFIRAFDEVSSGVTIGAETTTFDITSAEAWHWWQLSAGAVSAVRVMSLPPSPSGGTVYEFGGRVFTSDSNSDFTESTIVEMTAQGGPVVRTTVQGFATALLQVR